MRSRWLTKRALTLHLALVVWTPGCLLAGWWQATRAMGGNSLSYLYSVEWPLFAVIGVWGWWALVHTDPDTAGARLQRRLVAEQSALAGSSGRPVPGAGPRRRGDDEDPALAAYNDRLEALATGGQAKTWRRR